MQAVASGQRMWALPVMAQCPHVHVDGRGVWASCALEEEHGGAAFRLHTALGATDLAVWQLLLGHGGCPESSCVPCRGLPWGSGSQGRAAAVHPMPTRVYDTEGTFMNTEAIKPHELQFQLCSQWSLAEVGVFLLSGESRACPHQSCWGPHTAELTPMRRKTTPVLTSKSSV